MAVEINPGLCAAAKENLRRNGISNAEVIVGDSHAFARQVLKWGSYELRRKGSEVVTYSFGAVLVDPPRCGLDSNTSRLVRRCVPTILFPAACPPHSSRTHACLTQPLPHPHPHPNQ
jgi:tRNA/tmRNA/rRNA uracil-C5-methylase (TrmA/RlmC/RlmD family)